MCCTKSALIIAAFIAYFSVQTCVFGFHDQISIIGRIKWNYTKYEENLWTHDYRNTSLTKIYADHAAFISQVAQLENEGISVVAGVQSIFQNQSELPFVHRVSVASEEVNKVWSEYSQWLRGTEFDVINTTACDVIQPLQTAMDDMWNTSNTQIYFEYMTNKSYACNVMGQREPAVYYLIEKYFMETIRVQMKSYILLQLAYLTEATKDYLRYHKIARDLRVTFNSRFALFTERTEEVVWKLSRDIWSCDRFNATDSYTQLTNFIQGYVDNEINLNPDGSCAPYCNDYKITRNYGCNKNTICGANYLDRNKTRCAGAVRDCDYFDSPSTYCSNEADSSSDRRINFVKMESGRVLGEEVFCPDEFKTKSWMNWFATCRYCFCYCDAPGPSSDRHFSLRDVTSNIDENKVISGIRLVKKNGIIHLTAIERTLLPDANLNTTESRIISNYNYKIADSGIKHGIDYYTMTYENRTMNLDTITATRDQIVTGVRFRIHCNRVHLEVRFTYFDESTGKLDRITESEWKMNSNTKRQIIPTDHRDVPTKATEQSNPIGGVDSNFIEFGPTGWAADMAQTTVPFIDSIAIEPAEPIALSGIGIFYKSHLNEDGGGFVAPKLVTYDFATTALRIRAAVGVYGI